METIKVVRCVCGLELRGTDEQLVPAVQQHGRELHNMDVTVDEVLAMATPADGPVQTG
jgi:hypothetical protein